MVSPSRVSIASGSSLPKPNLDQHHPQQYQEPTQPDLEPLEPLEPPTPHNVTPVSHKAKRSIKQVFAKKRFYLDIKTKSAKSPQIKNIIEEIQILGGTIEEFFSKEVTTVISDAPDWKLKSPGTAPSSQAVVSPPTPCSLQPLSNASWSPATPATPTEEKRKLAATPKSRVETILERAHVQAQGTCDVIEIAHKLKIHIWSLHKLWKWLEELKKKFGPLRKTAGPWRLHQRSQSVDSSLHSHSHRPLVSPYIKFEATTRQHKPVIHEFKRFPKLFLGGKFLGSPFYPPDSSQNKFVHKRLNLEDTREKVEPSEEPDHHRDKHAKSTRKESVRNPPKTPTKKRPATPSQTPGVSAQKRERPGFCELCNLEFTDLNTHIETEMHEYWGLNASHWVHVDSCINVLNSTGPVAPCLA
ncbi:protein DBF4 homolog B-like [Tigriopus californicus]|uniref:protein DBF4 homolog B-like n=1 Tax=Tigriopus californicus TaxID=6832 RepID=UPI0027D9E26B|nr:protein DBF4 homolog B-like [Tigriopus californicus]